MMPSPDNSKNSAAKAPNQMGNSLEFLERASFWANALTVGFGVMAALGAVAVVIVSSRLGNLKDLELDAFKRSAELRIAEQQERAAIAERQLLEVREKLRPRIISESQRFAIAAAMKSLALLPNTNQRQSVAVFPSSAVFEAANLADQIAETLTHAGWDVNRHPVTFGKALSVSGVGLLTSSNSRGIRVATALAAALNANGIFAFHTPEKRSGCEEMEGMTDARIASAPWCSQVSVFVGDHP
jgi:hypothetical protein